MIKNARETMYEMRTSSGASEPAPKQMGIGTATAMQPPTLSSPVSEEKARIAAAAKMTTKPVKISARPISSALILLT